MSLIKMQCLTLDSTSIVTVKWVITIVIHEHNMGHYVAPKMFFITLEQRDRR